jgi:hypothetical protein
MWATETVSTLEAANCLTRLEERLGTRRGIVLLQEGEAVEPNHLVRNTALVDLLAYRLGD